MKYSSLLLAAFTATTLTFSGCCGTGGDTFIIQEGGSNVNNNQDDSETSLSGDIRTNRTLSSDKTWSLDGLLVIKPGATLTIEPGTTIKAKPGTGDNTSYLVVDKGAKIIAEGTATNPIVFTSEDESPGAGKWGGITIIGNAGNSQVKAYEVNSDFEAGTSNMADDSGILTHVHILNSGITMETDKEINGLSLVGVGSGTTISDIVVTDSDDDCVEAWGGTVDMTNLTLTGCTDDFFDIDDGYSGTVTGLRILANGTGNAGIEQSGNTAATFVDFDITINENAKEGGIFFKKSGIGGHFQNGSVTMSANTVGGAIFSEGTADTANTSFSNVTLTVNGGPFFENKDADASATEIETVFDSDNSNTKIDNTN